MSIAFQGDATFNSDKGGRISKQIRDRLQIFLSYSYREFVVLYDIDTIFYKPHKN